MWLKAVDPTPAGNPERYKEAMEVLHRFCANEKDAIPALTAALNEKDETVRNAAAEAIKKIGRN